MFNRKLSKGQIDKQKEFILAHYKEFELDHKIKYDLKQIVYDLNIRQLNNAIKIVYDKIKSNNLSQEEMNISLNYYHAIVELYLEKRNKKSNFWKKMNTIISNGLLALSFIGKMMHETISVISHIPFIGDILLIAGTIGAVGMIYDVLSDR